MPFLWPAAVHEIGSQLGKLTKIPIGTTVFFTILQSAKAPVEVAAIFLFALQFFRRSRFAVRLARLSFGQTSLLFFGQLAGFLLARTQFWRALKYAFVFIQHFDIPGRHQGSQQCRRQTFLEFLINSAAAGLTTLFLFWSLVLFVGSVNLFEV